MSGRDADRAGADPIAAALAGDKRAIGRLISVFEDRRPGAGARRGEILAALGAYGPPRARFVGVTGAPGAGKSTLVGALAMALVAADAQRAVAVLAVDPSSQISGGAFLGDRTRVRFPAAERRLFFRSQASDRELGGVSRHTFAVCRLLRHLFDYVFIETVGIGQSEIEIQHVADLTYLVLQPMAGDHVQFMKAGIMEIPDAFILNKCDEAAHAQASYHALRASLSLARLGGPGRLEPPIMRTSASTGMGVDAVLQHLLAASAPRRSWADKEAYFFERWVLGELGRAGIRVLERRGGARAQLERAGTYDDAQASFLAECARDPGAWLGAPEP